MSPRFVWVSYDVSQQPTSGRSVRLFTALVYVNINVKIKPRMKMLNKLLQLQLNKPTLIQLTTPAELERQLRLTVCDPLQAENILRCYYRFFPQLLFCSNRDSRFCSLLYFHCPLSLRLTFTVTCFSCSRADARICSIYLAVSIWVARLNVNIPDWTIKLSPCHRKPERTPFFITIYVLKLH